MIKKLVKHGNSSALIIDKPILDLLHIDENTSLDLSTDGVKLIITPLKISISSSILKDSLAKTNKIHSRTLKKLAK
ncbi:MAG TPA: AbrB/MazE/SpoVT family DNA-binding domain-containing protein [Clostridiales bacterium]|nr:AbrB/MazE/SpoVT family DNA-binding domain-containing protein [Clostridiales bacterium]HQP69941.1 AbrB/MazE/SpoVT family DNA-binding domain-containing protein [Clostridiales bacterium]